MSSHILHEQFPKVPILHLDQTVLLVLPGHRSGSEDECAREADAKQSSHVVQVTIETAENNKGARKADTIAAFFMVQHEISELVVLILWNQLSHPLPTPIKFVQQAGPAPYALVAESRPWPFGESLSLTWGGKRLVPSELKWTFKFEALTEAEQAD